MLVGTRTRRGVTMVSVVLGTPSVARAQRRRLRAPDAGAPSATTASGRSRRRAVASPPIRYRRGAQLELVTDGSRHAHGAASAPASPPATSACPAEVGGPDPRAARGSGAREVLADGELIAVVPVVASASVPEAGPAQKTKDWFTKPLALVLARGRRWAVRSSWPAACAAPPRRRAGRTESEAAA